jgi:hypothetical protein
MAVPFAQEALVALQSDLLEDQRVNLTPDIPRKALIAR